MSLKKNSTIYLVSNILNSIIPFLFLPILTRVLSPEEYGQVAMFQMLIMGLVAFVGLNTVGAAGRKYYDHDMKKEELATFNGSCIHVLGLTTFLALLLSVIFSDSLSYFLSIPKAWVFSAITFSALNYILQLRLNQWQIRGAALHFGTLQVTNGLLNVGLSLILILFLNHGPQGRIEGQVITVMIFAVISSYLLVKDGLLKPFTWKRDYIYESLKFGVPLVPHVFGMFLLSTIDRFFINKELGLEQAGIYMVVVQVSLVFNIIFDAINKAYVPWLYETLKRNIKGEKEKVVRYTYLYFFLLVAIAPVPFIIGPWIISTIAGGNYNVSGTLIGFICLGQIFGGMYLMVTNYIFYSKRNTGLSVITLCSGAINVGLLLYLIERYGLEGAAYAFSISMFIRFLMTWAYSNKVVNMPWFSIVKRSIN